MGRQAGRSAYPLMHVGSAGASRFGAATDKTHESWPLNVDESVECTMSKLTAQYSALREKERR